MADSAQSSAAPKAGVRRTRQRAAVGTVMADLADFNSAQQIHDRLRQDGVSVGLATVYRTLQAMEAAGELDMIRNDEGEVLYRQCESVRHHHHLVCRSCGRTVEVEGAAVESWAESVARANGFSDVRHDLEIFGTCHDCAAKAD
ncbi:Fur family transcriptional regulator [Parenemella sanctibonifatiensis]|uniref:Transcriptional repressor n=1 Tax=Parenemella sanctibonifatiensis TaxID=2016505 RepID=A0A255EH01_9ACTN|nr:Fur family transcriptional regulator [Parenemella sanctibonifatiensis]OYN90819.1 transcriptional repressor [Parenemella sanctibonifatiensis]